MASHLNPDGTVALDDDPFDDGPRPHLAPAAIAACALCDPDGYTPAGQVCDHIDHRPAAARGMQLVREALRKDCQR